MLIGFTGFPQPGLMEDWSHLLPQEPRFILRNLEILKQILQKLLFIGQNLSIVLCLDAKELSAFTSNTQCTHDFSTKSSMAFSSFMTYSVKIKPWDRP